MAQRAMVLMLALLAISPAAAAEAHYLYKAKLVQAAPGKLLELIDLYKSAAVQASGDQPPVWIRHSQGDRWDLLILFPMDSYTEYYRPERVARRDKATASADLAGKFRQDIAWQEDVFVYGPPLDEVKKAFADAALFHVEMFQSLPGKQADLYHEREMENAFSHALKEPENLIFVRDQGAAWDLFTIGCFRNLRHYAESEAVSAADRDAAAKAAGFTDAGQIGPYLRTFIALHHDTLAVAVK